MPGCPGNHPDRCDGCRNPFNDNDKNNHNDRMRCSCLITFRAPDNIQSPRQYSDNIQSPRQYSRAPDHIQIRAPLSCAAFFDDPDSCDGRQNPLHDLHDVQQVSRCPVAYKSSVHVQRDQRKLFQKNGKLFQSFSSSSSSRQPRSMQRSRW